VANIGNRGLQGQPTLPYARFKSYVGADVFLDMAFVDHTDTPVVATTLVYQLDDITDVTNMIPATTLTPAASTYTLQIPGASMQMTFPYLSSQLCQLAGYFQAIDTVTGSLFTAPFVYIIELCAIMTPAGLTIP
jgi:hypothetical protein